VPSFISLIHCIHLMAAGIWLGGLVFTATVVTPAFRRMAWSDVERLAVRSELGRQYAKVARINLIILVAGIVAEGALTGFGSILVAELTFVFFIALLSELHARYAAPRLVAAVRGEIQADRRKLLRLSVAISVLNLLASTGLMILAGLLR
jgi:uncharacterized membrane protein